jgi:glycosyltransferase involved in cell wall biosynthesis
MKILLLCNKPPWPPLEGGPIAMNAMVKGLIESGHQVKVLAVNARKYNVNASDIPESYQSETGIELVEVDLSLRPLPALWSLIKRESYHVSRFISNDFKAALKRILINEKFDIIQFETLYTTPYISLIRSLSDAKLVLRAHNIEHLIWKRIAGGETNPVKKFYLSHLASALEKYEKQTLNLLNGVVAITPIDASWFIREKSNLPVTAIPFGMKTTASGAAESSTHAHKNFFHLGSMNWMPNQEGIRWFIKEVWPEATELFPGITFSLAGRSMPGEFSKLSAPGVVVDGEVPDASEYMRQHGVMIVPLFSGSGIRIKIIEGMMAGKAIITTPVGAEGINYTNGKNILIAETAGEMLKAIEFVMKNPEAIDSIGNAARQLVAAEHNNSLLMQKLNSFYIDLY